MCIAFLIIAKYCDTCIQVFGPSPVDRRKLYEKKDFKFKSEILQFAIANRQEGNKRKTVLLFANFYPIYTRILPNCRTSL